MVSDQPNDNEQLTEDASASVDAEVNTPSEATAFEEVTSEDATPEDGAWDEDVAEEEEPVATTSDPDEAAPVADASDAPTSAASADAASAPLSTTDTEDEDEVGAADDDGEDEEDEGDSSQDSGESPNGLRRGDVREGTIREATPTQILVDLGDDIVGLVTSREMERLDRGTLEQLQPGNSLTVYVLRAANEDGQPVLSINRAKEEVDWRKAEEYEQSKQVYAGRIAGYNKGGLIVRFGRLRGFIPASQISQERERRAQGGTPDERWGTMLNEEILVKVVEVNRSRNRLILSERAAARETRERQKEELINSLTVGERYTGKVISLTDFGAFVDLGGADGLIHLTELSWKHVTHPREVVEVGDEVEVKVISIDPERKRIGLSMKSSEEDPWEEVQRTYRVDQLVQGRITKLTRFGAFASLVDNADVEGLIHVSELADYRVDHPRDVVAVGDVLTLRVVKIDAERRRLGLSLKRVDSARYMESDWGVE